jgi:hypothetical protein
MRNWILGTVIALVTAGLGVGAAYGVKTVAEQNAPAIRSAIQNTRGQIQQARGNGPSQPGGQPSFRTRNMAPLTMDQAIAEAEAYRQKNGTDWKIAKVLEFQNGFDVIFVEAGTGRGAAQLILPKTGRMMQMVPALRWNLKYGPAGDAKSSASEAADNTVLLDDARAAALAFLVKNQPSATVNDGGYSFYGYYLFEYSVDGKTAGMVLVNGLTSEAAQLPQLGAFLSEKEMSQ